MSDTEVPFYLKPFITTVRKRPRYNDDSLVDGESPLKKPLIESSDDTNTTKN